MKDLIILLITAILVSLAGQLPPLHRSPPHPVFAPDLGDIDFR